MTNDKHTLGKTADVDFADFRKTINGKVDTGATTSSLHASKIKVSGSQVSFVAPQLSDNVITMDLSSHQEVASADGGNQTRPVVNFDITINGVNMHNVEFNLNDRSNMDSAILIGQNILTDGEFVVDVNDEDNGDTDNIDNDIVDKNPQDDVLSVDKNDKIIEAIINNMNTVQILLTELLNRR